MTDVLASLRKRTALTAAGAYRGAEILKHEKVYDPLLADQIIQVISVVDSWSDRAFQDADLPGAVDADRAIESIRRLIDRHVPPKLGTYQTMRPDVGGYMPVILLKVRGDVGRAKGREPDGVSWEIYGELVDRDRVDVTVRVGGRVVASIAVYSRFESSSIWHEAQEVAAALVWGGIRAARLFKAPEGGGLAKYERKPMARVEVQPISEELAGAVSTFVFRECSEHAYQGEGVRGRDWSPIEGSGLSVFVDVDGLDGVLVLYVPIGTEDVESIGRWIADFVGEFRDKGSVSATKSYLTGPLLVEEIQIGGALYRVSFHVEDLPPIQVARVGGIKHWITAVPLEESSYEV